MTLPTQQKVSFIVSLQKQYPPNPTIQKKTHIPKPTNQSTNQNERYTEFIDRTKREPKHKHSRISISFLSKSLTFHPNTKNQQKWPLPYLSPSPLSTTTTPPSPHLFYAPLSPLTYGPPPAPTDPTP